MKKGMNHLPLKISAVEGICIAQSCFKHPTNSGFLELLNKLSFKIYLTNESLNYTKLILISQIISIIVSVSIHMYTGFVNSFLLLWQSLNPFLDLSIHKPTH
jgi:hypothetical protein